MIIRIIISKLLESPVECAFYWACSLFTLENMTSSAPTIKMVKSRVDMKRYRKRKNSRLLGAGPRCVDIQVYLNVSPFVDSAFAALAVHVSLCIGAGHFEAGEFPVIT